MASDEHFAEFIQDQTRLAGSIKLRKMFGEYAVYLDGKVVALICDNQLFVKPTGPGRALLGHVREAPPYPKAKLYFLIDDILDNADRLSKLLCVTAHSLPPPKPKKAPPQKKWPTKSAI